jgi:GNAT superfamily N-acetyltransferase
MMHARPLTPHDAPACRDLRLYALRTEEGAFSSTFAKETKFTTQEWADLCTETPDKCLFGLFDDMKLAGVLLAKKWEKDIAGKTVYWGYAYIHPAYRGRGEGKSLYALREAWSIEHGFSRAVFNFFAHNKRSMEIHISRGAKPTHSE